MKNLIKLLGIAAIVAVIGFTMVACPEPEEEGGPTSFGDKMEFSGEQVYVNKALQPYSTDYKPYDGADITFSSRYGATPKITGGKFSFSVGVPATGDLEGIDLDEWYSDSDYTDVKISDSSVKYASFSSFYGNNSSLYRENYEYSNVKVSGSGEDITITSGSMNGEYVSFVYVDKAVTITGKGKTNTETYEGHAYTSKYNDINLSLSAGWNTVCTKTEYSISATSTSYTNTQSVSNPSSLKWVLDIYED
jgi:hypothetical protein